MTATEFITDIASTSTPLATLDSFSSLLEIGFAVNTAAYVYERLRDGKEDAIKDKIRKIEDGYSLTINKHDAGELEADTVLYTNALIARQQLTKVKGRYQSFRRRIIVSVVEYVSYLSPWLALVALFVLLFGSAYEGSFAHHPYILVGLIVGTVLIAYVRYMRHLFLEYGLEGSMVLKHAIAPTGILIGVALITIGFTLPVSLVDPIMVVWILCPPFVAFILENLFLNGIYKELCVIYQDNIKLFESKEETSTPTRYGTTT